MVKVQKYYSWFVTCRGAPGARKDYFMLSRYGLSCRYTFGVIGPKPRKEEMPVGQGQCRVRAKTLYESYEGQIP